MPETRDIVIDAPQPMDAGARGRNVVVVIGIDRYDHWRELDNAVADARGARSLFLRLGFEEVVPPLLDSAATRAALDALVNDDLARLGPRDSLVVFFAGHGGAKVHGRGDTQVKIGHLVPVDASVDLVSTWINLEAWLRAIALLPPRHILVILDACYSGVALGPVIKWRDDGASPTTPLATLQARPSRRVITSALDDERALDSGPIPGHSLFTGALIEALTGGIASPTGVTTGSEVGLWVRQRVRTYPRATQTPDFGAFDFDERGEMVIPLLGGAIETSAPASPDQAPGAAPPTTPAVPGRLLSALRRERDWLMIAAPLLAATLLTTVMKAC